MVSRRGDAIKRNTCFIINVTSVNSGSCNMCKTRTFPAGCESESSARRSRGGEPEGCRMLCWGGCYGGEDAGVAHGRRGGIGDGEVRCLQLIILGTTIQAHLMDIKAKLQLHSLLLS